VLVAISVLKSTKPLYLSLSLFSHKHFFFFKTMHPTSALALAIVALNAANTVVGLPTGQENWRRSDIEDLVARHDKPAGGHVEGGNPGFARRAIPEPSNRKSTGPDALVAGGTGPGYDTIARASGEVGVADPSLGGNRHHPRNRPLTGRDAPGTQEGVARAVGSGLELSGPPHDVTADGRPGRLAHNTDHWQHHHHKGSHLPSRLAGLAQLHGGHSPNPGSRNVGSEAGVTGPESDVDRRDIEAHGDSGASPVPGTSHSPLVGRDYDDDMESVD